jgi:hypothetical protein
MSLTIQCGVHAPYIDQQTHHGHVDGRRPLRQQLVLQYLAALAALSHCVQVDVCERVSRFRLSSGLVRLGEDLLLVLEDILQKVELDVFAPERYAVLLLQVPDLVARIHRRDTAIGIASHRRGVRCVDGPLRLGTIVTLVVHVVGAGRVGLRSRGWLCVVHWGGVGGEDVPEAVPGVEFVGARRRWRCGRVCIHVERGRDVV